MDRRAKTVIAIIAGVAVLVVGLALAFPTQPGDQTVATVQPVERQEPVEDLGSYDKRLEAFAVSQRYVEEELKDARSADFPPFGEVQAGTSYDEASGVYTVVAFVDAKNGLGETVREAYVCELVRDGSDWKRISLRFE